MTHDALKFDDLAKVFPGAEAKPGFISRSNAGGKTRVLVAADDPLYTLAVYQGLAEAGYEVVAAERGTEAVAELRKSDHPPVAILDWKMPGMHGSEICERMRDAGKNIYLILTSEEPTSAEIVAGLEVGADQYLPKSVPIPELLAHVKVGVRITNRQRTMNQRVAELSGTPIALEG